MSPFGLAAALMATFVAARWPLWEQALFSDHSPAAWLSSAQLLGAAFLAARLGFDGALPRGLSIWIAVALFGLAIDEQFMLHEQWKYGCANWMGACAYAAVRELPMILVAVVGALALFALMRVIDDTLCRGLVTASLAVGLAALGTDLAGSPALLAPFEEAIEVAAEALFIGALLVVPNPRT